MATTKYPPRLSVEGAVRVIRTMYEEHQSREVSMDLMPTILKTKQTSSFFEDKINALQKFGFIEKRPNDLLYLTDLAMQVIKPFGDEESEAKITALKKVDVLAELLEKYPNGKLPSAEQLKQSLMKTYGVPRERVTQWYDFVVESFRVLPSKIEVHVAETVRATESVGATLQDYQFSVPVGDGSTIRVSIPKAATLRDLKTVKAMIDALMTEEE